MAVKSSLGWIVMHLVNMLMSTTILEQSSYIIR